MTSVSRSPVRVDARLDQPLSRWLWLVKWLLLIPHAIVLGFLWIAVAVLTVIAFIAILVTGRYPRSLFDFNLGVLRWTWRVAYYGYSALGTDRYPPFSLGPEPDYPARLDIDYPQRLSRGLVLVKWWLLAIPHYVLIALFLGFSGSVAGPDGPVSDSVPGLLTLVVLIAAVGLLVTGRYPRGLYDFALGMIRWAVRVGAYAGLMTDAYPPFRLDQGGPDPAAPVEPVAPAGGHTVPAPAVSSGWSAGRVVTAVLGALLLFGGTVAAAGGAGVLWLDQTQRDPAGYLSTGTETFRVDGHALRFEPVDIDWDRGAPTPAQTIGDVRVRAESLVPGAAVFVGIGPTAEVDRYLAGVATGRVRDLSRDRDVVASAGGAPELPPTAQSFWVATVTGGGRQELTWAVASGEWSVVVMNADGDAPVVADLSGGVTVPVLTGLAVGLLVGGGVAVALGGLLVFLAARRHPGPEERAPAVPGPVPVEPDRPVVVGGHGARPLP